MPSRNATIEHEFRFSISSQDASLTKAQIRALVAQATKDAEEEAKKDGEAIEVKSGLPGGFGGIGEAVVVLTLLAKTATGAKIIAGAVAAGKTIGGAFAGGTATAGGKYFFDKYLAPRLKSANLKPSKFQATSKPAAPAAKKTAPSAASKKKAAKRRRG